ncbi:DUF6443 domain-containing protein [Chryseobacterium rhizoplanae]|uniref:DUF6443 domain-containing protein n=1 Tax=Chryseobacterium rhizoplanae TaxID=1609531 RepID=UPI001CE32B69|nr:DUF6443 domain-containing protein [Chryseobacterium rhizoplanae]UCA61684.1 DUF6443 domain-containing protein [Chryseobacterium rhizoplanae]
MKKILNTFGVLFVVLFSAQTNLTNTENYTYEKTCLNEDCSKKFENVQYFDSWGKLVQSIDIKGSPSGKDIVSHVEYDNFGRQVKSYLPVPQQGTQDGSIYASPLSNASAIYGGEKIYSESILENSPLDKVLQQIQLGNDWNSKPVNFGYDVNTTADGVKKFSVTTWKEGATEAILSESGIYIDGKLYKSSVTDEDGNIAIQFKNNKGQLILSRKVLNASENADTYYVYNEYGHLVFVLPPLASAREDITANTIKQDELCYQYHYDGWNRLVEKKVPGKGWEYMVYDKSGRMILTQDANLKAANKWLISKYDPLGRIAYTGFLTGGDRAGRQNQIKNLVITEERSTTGFTRNGITVYYTDSAFVGEIPTILTVNYYDTYPAGTPAAPSQIMGQNVLKQPGFGSNFRTTQSFPLASFVKNIEDDNWTKSYTWYDTNGRLIGSQSINHLGGYTISETELDFAGVVKKTKVYHKRLDTDTEKVITQTLTYDNQNRLLVNKHKIDNNPEEILTQNEYDELSRVRTKKVGGTDIFQPLQVMDYTYNIRGWLTKINDPANLNGKLFGYEVKYNNPAYTNIAGGKYNGNITEVDWRNASEDVLKRYTYSYDALNRLKDAIYTEPNSTTPFNNKYNEHLTYDLNGNISTLKRNASPATGNTATQVDDLVYEYSGNRLTKVLENALNDAGYEGGNNPITYDQNGNMKDMLDKGIQSIGYNFLDLPNELAITEKFLDQFSHSNITTLYGADGTKLRKTNFKEGKRGSLGSTRITDYLDGFQYTYFDKGLSSCLFCKSNSAYEAQAYKNINDPVLQVPEWKLDFVATAEGFYSFTENRYIYQYTDHLGNTRVSFAKNSAGVLEIADTNNFYPFGLNHIAGNEFNTSRTGSFYSYKYNGKELQETGMYDYGARMYMPDLGRWGVADAYAEAMRRHSPYNYAFNNPVNFIDPDGNSPRDTYGEHSAFNGDFDPNTSLSGYNGMGGSHGMYFAADAGGGIAGLSGNLSGMLGKMYTLGGNWDNIGGSFLDGNGINLDYSGKYLSLNIYNKDENGEVHVEVPEVVLSGGSPLVWALQLRNHVNAFMQGWNSQSDLEWKKLTCGHCFDGPIKYIGGAGDPLGIWEALGIASSASGSSGMKLAALPLLMVTRNGDDALKMLAAEKGLLSKELPTQIHHFATNKNKKFTPEMEEIAGGFDLKLNGSWNKQAMPHLGRHPNAYHEFVLKGMRNARDGAGGSQAKFLELFNQNVKQPVINNPGLLRKSGWK